MATEFFAGYVTEWSLSVDSEALVMPSSNGRPRAGWPPRNNFV